MHHVHLVLVQIDHLHLIIIENYPVSFPDAWLGFLSPFWAEWIDFWKGQKVCIVLNGHCEIKQMSAPKLVFILRADWQKNEKKKWLGKKESV